MVKMYKVSQNFGDLTVRLFGGNHGRTGTYQVSLEIPSPVDVLALTLKTSEVSHRENSRPSKTKLEKMAMGFQPLKKVGSLYQAGVEFQITVKGENERNALNELAIAFNWFADEFSTIIPDIEWQKISDFVSGFSPSREDWGEADYANTPRIVVPETNSGNGLIHIPDSAIVSMKRDENPVKRPTTFLAEATIKELAKKKKWDRRDLHYNELEREANTLRELSFFEYRNTDYMSALPDIERAVIIMDFILDNIPDATLAKRYAKAHASILLQRTTERFHYCVNAKQLDLARAYAYLGQLQIEALLDRHLNPKEIVVQGLGDIIGRQGGGSDMGEGRSKVLITPDFVKGVEDNNAEHAKLEEYLAVRRRVFEELDEVCPSDSRAKGELLGVKDVEALTLLQPEEIIFIYSKVLPGTPFRPKDPEARIMEQYEVISRRARTDPLGLGKYVLLPSLLGSGKA